MASSVQAFAKASESVWTKGFVQVRPNQRLYVEQRKAAPGRPTLLLCNGLTWSTEQWQPLVKALDVIDPTIGIVLYDMEGMGKTLLDKAPITFDIPFENQVRDLKSLHDTLNIQGPVILGGLSYGGGLAIQYMAEHPGDFDKMLLMAPYLEPLPTQDQWIRQQVAITRAANPLNPYSDDQLYDFFLRQLVYTTYPILEPIMLENPYKTEGVYRMVKGAKNWHAANVVKNLPAGKLHVMAGSQDPYVSLDSQKQFWNSVAPNVRQSFIIVSQTQHELPKDRPDYTAAWVLQVVDNNPELNKGLTFDGDPLKFTATSGSVVIPLGAGVQSCDNDLLRKISQTR